MVQKTSSCKIFWPHGVYQTTHKKHKIVNHDNVKFPEFEAEVSQIIYKILSYLDVSEMLKCRI